MALGHKTGGRVAGTPNKATADIRERLAAMGCYPLEGPCPDKPLAMVKTKPDGSYYCLDCLPEIPQGTEGFQAFHQQVPTRSY
jgi:hypothetical protein